MRLQVNKNLVAQLCCTFLLTFFTEHQDSFSDPEDVIFTPTSNNNRPMGQKQAKKLKVSQDLEERRIRSLEEIAEAAKARNKLLETHSKVLSASNDVNFLTFVTMDTTNLEPVAREIVEVKRRQYLKALKELDSDNEEEVNNDN